MTAQISAYGRLVADPETRTTGKGTSMAMAGWRYRCRAMPQRTGRLPSGWASLPLGSRPMRWPNTRKAIS